MWTPDSDTVCSSSIAKYFSDAGRDVKLHKNRFNARTEFGLQFPEIGDADDNRFFEIAEYIGLVMLGCSVEQNDLSSYQPPSDCIEIGRGKTIHCKGFITPNTIRNLINELRSITNNNSNFPWIALSTVFYSIPETTSRMFIISKDKIYSL